MVTDSYTNYYPSSRLFHASVPHIMGTRIDVLLFGDDPSKLKLIWDEILTETRRLERMLNRFDTDSAIYGVNRDGVLYPVGMEEELWHILRDCKRYYELTDCYFDVTLGHFDEVVFDDRNRTVFLANNADFDLGGYAKGYALRRIRQILETNAISRALVNFGDSAALGIGAHPHGNSWPLSVDNPYNGAPLGIFRLYNSALSVSGNMPSHPEHIISPITGAYVTERKITVVVADDPVDAEVLTTAFMATDEETAKKIAERFSIKDFQLYRCE